jgi:FtsH-binding integral membrane protein
MSDFNRGFTRAVPASGDMSVDAGLRAFMLGVYNKMALGLLLSAALAWLTADYAPVRDALYIVSPSGAFRGFTTAGTIVKFLPLAAILAMMFMRRPSPRSANLLYWGVVASIGAGAGVWLLAYTGASVASTFLITASAFGILSLVGYTTKRDLTGMGNFLIMGVWGLIAASLINMFLHMPAISMIVSVLGVLIFAGLTAYDTQRLKTQYYALGGDQTSLSVATSYGALTLYLDFINLFQFLMSLLGSRR